MVAIRGATTVEKDTPNEIKSAVGELIAQILSRNNISAEKIICVTFSSTNDLRSYYPAKAAREWGLFTVPLFSALEPDIKGALGKCIRVLMLVESNVKPIPVYLHGASALRKDLSAVYNVAIDGPAGSGKSTVAKKVAEKFGIICLDTGAMYRACALKCLNEGVSVSDENSVNLVLRDTVVTVKNGNGAQLTYLDGVNVTDKIRTNEISMAASTVSAHALVRSKMVDLQREIASKTSCVLDGRDIGTNVLPCADFKFYLTARPEVRARRRADENAIKGINSDYDKILKEIILRDSQDENRLIAPLKIAADAVVIDTSDMSIDEVVSAVVCKIQEKI